MDREVEQRFPEDDEFEVVQVIDANTGEVLYEQRFRKDVDPIEFTAAMYEQLDLDADDVQESMEMGLKDIRRELGEDTTSRFRYEP